MIGFPKVQVRGKFMMSASTIQAQIYGLPDRHILKRSSQGYIDQFISALLYVYSGSKLVSVLGRIR
jgi:hypothetical protein